MIDENIYHRYLKLPFELKKPEQFDYYGDTIKHFAFRDVVLPELQDWFDSLGLTCGLAEGFYTPPNSKIPIHTDWGTYTNHVKINTTWGPDEGMIQWWKSDIVQKREIMGQLQGYTSEHHVNLWANSEDCTFLYEANTNKPSLVNVGILHGTYNPTNYGRWTLALGPRSSEYEDGIIPWWDALEIFKNYLE